MNGVMQRFATDMLLDAELIDHTEQGARVMDEMQTKLEVANNIREELMHARFKVDFGDSEAALLLQIPLEDRGVMGIQLTADYELAVVDAIDFLYIFELCGQALVQVGSPEGRDLGREVCIAAVTRITNEVRRMYDILRALAKRAGDQAEKRILENIRIRLAEGEAISFTRNKQQYLVESVDRDGERFIELRAIGDHVDPYVPVGKPLLTVACDADIGASVDRFLTTPVFGRRTLQENLPYIEFA